MSERHELEMKAEELFNMTFGPLTWNPDDEDEAKDIVDCAVKDGLMAMPDAEDMEECLDDVARDAQEKMRDDIIERVLFWYQDWFTEKAYYSVPDGMQGLVLDVLGVEY